MRIRPLNEGDMAGPPNGPAGCDPAHVPRNGFPPPPRKTVSDAPLGPWKAVGAAAVALVACVTLALTGGFLWGCVQFGYRLSLKLFGLSL